MATRKEDKATKARVVAPEWRGFPGRLRFAIDQRQAENEELTQNQIAAAAGVDSGNLSKYLAGTKTDVTASTVILLARALRVRPAWLLTGEEPTGLRQEADVLTPAPSSSVRSSRRP